jgi:peroxiredoxin
MDNVLKVGDKAPTATLYDVKDDAVNLADTWREKPVFLTFLRHFGCIHCRYMLVQLEKHNELIVKAGLNNVAIAIGQPKHAAHFGTKLAPSITSLTIESNDVHYLYGLKRAGVEQVFNPKMMMATIKSFAAGQVQGQATGDITMLGGIFIVDRGGIIQYASANEFAGDYPLIPDIIAEYTAPAASISQQLHSQKTG